MSFFRNIKFSCCGRLHRLHSEMRIVVERAGGSLSRKVNNSVSYLICSDDAYKTMCDEVQIAQNKGVTIVRESFINACIKERRLLNVHRAKNSKFVFFIPPPHIQMSKLFPSKKKQPDEKKKGSFSKNSSKANPKKKPKKKMTNKLEAKPGPVSLDSAHAHAISSVSDLSPKVPVSSYKFNPIPSSQSPKEDLIVINKNDVDPNKRTLVWHDPAVFNSENQQYMKAFCNAGFNVEAFWSWAATVTFLRNTARNQKVVVLTSGTDGEKLVKCIEKFPNILSVLVFCGNVQYHKQWAEKYTVVSHVVGSNAEVTAITKELLMAKSRNSLSRSLSIFVISIPLAQVHLEGWKLLHGIDKILECPSLPPVIYAQHHFSTWTL